MVQPERQCIDCGRALAYWRGRPAVRCGECQRGRRRIKQRPSVTCIDCGSVFEPANQTGALPKRCRPCAIVRKKQTDVEKQRRWRDADPERKARLSREANERQRQRPDYSERRRAKILRLTYGMTTDDYANILSSQEGVCAICRGGPRGNGKNFHVDHCHKSGRVRGLLCSNCNTLLGLAGDDPSRLEVAAEYLRKHT